MEGWKREEGKGGRVEGWKVGRTEGGKNGKFDNKLENLHNKAQDGRDFGCRRFCSLRFLGKPSVLVSQTGKFVVQKSIMRKS